jgi:hypothetical protein
MAVGTVTLSAHAKVGNVRTITYAVVASATDGSIPTKVLPAFEGRLLALGTTPGATQPTTLYDITLLDQYGHDVLEGVGANRSASAAEKVPIVYSGTGTHPPIDEADTLTLTFANNSVNSAALTVVLYYALGA